MKLDITQNKEPVESLQNVPDAVCLKQQGMTAYEAGDYAIAVELWRKSAEMGNVTAQYNLACLYYKGEGVCQDYAQAAVWVKKAAEQGHADAQYNLGSLYKTGKGVPKSMKDAAKWYKMALENKELSKDKLNRLDAGCLKRIIIAVIFLTVAGALLFVLF